MRRTLVCMVLLLAACGSDEDQDDAEISMEEAHENAPPCAELWAEGSDVDSAIKAGDEIGCVDADGEWRFVGNATEQCTDGRTLYWNDEGWGYSGGEWHRHADGSENLVAPEDERNLCSG